MKRRDFLTLSVKAAMAAGYTAAIPTALLRTHASHAAILAAGLSDPAMQPLFVNPVPMHYLQDSSTYRIIISSVLLLRRQYR